MTNINRAMKHLDSLDRLYAYASGYQPSNAERAQALADAGLLMPDPTIIRTVEELEALDPDTLLMHRAYRALILPGVADETDLPLSVVTPGEQVRAAREALEEA